MQRKAGNSKKYEAVGKGKHKAGNRAQYQQGRVNQTAAKFVGQCAYYYSRRSGKRDVED
jgi:hypothetical protein